MIPVHSEDLNSLGRFGVSQLFVVLFVMTTVKFDNSKIGITRSRC